MRLNLTATQDSSPASEKPISASGYSKMKRRCPPGPKRHFLAGNAREFYKGVQETLLANELNSVLSGTETPQAADLTAMPYTRMVIKDVASLPAKPKCWPGGFE